MNLSNKRHSKINDTNRKYLSDIPGIDLAKIYDGLVLLLQASIFQAQLPDQPDNKHEFAEELDELHRKGMTNPDLRWLVLHEYLIHLIETTSAKDKSRKFKDAENLEFKDRSCFQLTAKGIELAQQLLNQDTRQSQGSRIGTDNQNGDLKLPSKPTPVWDKKRRELRFDGAVIKRFSRNASNQEKILSAFEEEGWPERIDNPLPPKEGFLCKARLRNTIQKLNELLQVKALSFRGDGTGEGVIWQCSEE